MPTAWYFGLPKYPKQPAVSYALDPTSRGAYAPYTPVELLEKVRGEDWFIGYSLSRYTQGIPRGASQSPPEPARDPCLGLVEWLERVA